MPTWPISRRTVLRGLGATLALPWLEAIEPVKPGGKPPVRLGFFYVPNGVVMANWKPTTTGSGFDLPPILKPLAAVRSQVLVLSNLNSNPCKHNVASHEPTGGAFLIGAKCKPSEVPEVAGPSIDQVAAAKIGEQTPIDALALGIEPGHRGDHGFSGTYLSHLSWRNSTTPVALETNPKDLYQRLFRGRAPQPANWTGGAAAKPGQPSSDTMEASVLDLVRDDAKALRVRLGSADRGKLEEYLEGLRGVERRLAATEGKTVAVAGRELVEPTFPAGKGIPKVYADHVDLMLDILVLAFQSDSTRVASFMFGMEKSGRAYPEIGAPGSHHSTSHHLNKPENLDQLTRINTHHITLFARFLDRLKKVPEGDGTLLDHALILYGSGISDGNKHNHDNLPILLAGGAGKTLSGGRHLACPDKTPLCNLFLEMLARAGLPIEQFGDSTGRLSLA